MSNELTEKELEEVEVEIVEEDKDNPNNNPVFSQRMLSEMSDEQKKILYMNRTQKAIATRRSNKKYKNSIQKAMQGLAEGTFQVLENGEVITGAEILAINAFQRAMHDNNALNIVLKLTGDLKEKVEISAPSYEQFVKGADIEY